MSCQPRSAAGPPKEVRQPGVNIVEYVQDESKQAIMKQEDARLLTIMEAAIQDYGTAADHTVSSGAHQVTELSGYITPDSFYDLVAMIDVHELESARILMNPVDYRDLFGVAA